MYPKKVANDTAKVLQSYLTYQAVRTIVDQLYETNPSLGIWLSQYSSKERIQDGEAYLQGLLQENKELMLRVLTVRTHLAEAVLEFLPSMVTANLEKSNTELRCQLLERLTQTVGSDSAPVEDGLRPDAESDNAPDE